MSEGYGFTRELRYNGRTSYLHMFSDMLTVPSEKEIAAALKRLLITPPAIAFLTGNGERRLGGNGDKDYKGIFTGKEVRDALINQGFDIDTINLQRQAIPDSLAALVIADPKIPFNKTDLQKIKAYVDRGGNLLVCGEPSREQNIQPVMNMLGVQLIPGTIASHSNDYEPDLLLSHLPADAARLSPNLNMLEKNGANIIFPGVAGLKYRDTVGYETRSFFVTNTRNSWNTTGNLDPEAHNLTINTMAGDDPGPFPIALTLTRKADHKEQRIMVVGDADFMATEGMLKNVPKNGNMNFVTALFSWFSYGQFPVDVSRGPAADDTIKVTKSQLSMLKWIFLGLIPGIILAGGAILLIRRKRN